MRNIKSFIKIIFIILLTLQFMAINNITRSQEQNKIEIDTITPDQIIRGEINEISIVGKNLSEIQSIEIIPPEGILVKEIKELKPIENEKKEGKKRWSINILAENKAQIGERKLVIVTPTEQSKEQIIKIVPYIPIIKDTKITSTVSQNAKVEFMLYVFSEGEDLGQKPQIVGVLFGEKGGFATIAKVTKIIKKNKKNSIVYAVVQGPPGTYAEGTYKMFIHITDKNGYESKSFETLVEFK
jgi:hypothetical protein